MISSTFSQKLIDVTKLAIPAVFCTLFMFMQNIVNLILVSSIHQPELVAAIGLGNGFINMFGMSVVVGMNGALNTLVSQAAGAK